MKEGFYWVQVRYPKEANQLGEPTIGRWIPLCEDAEPDESQINKQFHSIPIEPQETGRWDVIGHLALFRLNQVKVIKYIGDKP